MGGVPGLNISSPNAIDKLQYDDDKYQSTIGWGKSKQAGTACGTIGMQCM